MEPMAARSSPGVARPQTSHRKDLALANGASCGCLVTQLSGALGQHPHQCPSRWPTVKLILESRL
ncbi:hypothetical protein VFPBJ_08488 [Purpureocillium lilacinum]|uniref:Uncharacterized protein n=1 Tax=Purpureocillium lilacinum TaxID=33203 RepID=A0A179GF32_PURLI|nr:hypothetical protein VFPBJ_08488 [Purpureocillium lilacinum]